MHEHVPRSIADKVENCGIHGFFERSFAFKRSAGGGGARKRLERTADLSDKDRYRLIEDAKNKIEHILIRDFFKKVPPEWKWKPRADRVAKDLSHLEGVIDFFKVWPEPHYNHRTNYIVGRTLYEIGRMEPKKRHDSIILLRGLIDSAEYWGWTGRGGCAAKLGRYAKNLEKLGNRKITRARNAKFSAEGYLKQMKNNGRKYAKVLASNADELMSIPPADYRPNEDVRRVVKYIMRQKFWKHEAVSFRWIGAAETIARQIAGGCVLRSNVKDFERSLERFNSTRGRNLRPENPEDLKRLANYNTKAVFIDDDGTHYVAKNVGKGKPLGIDAEDEKCKINVCVEGVPGALDYILSGQFMSGIYHYRVMYIAIRAVGIMAENADEETKQRAIEWISERRKRSDWKGWWTPIYAADQEISKLEGRLSEMDREKLRLILELATEIRTEDYESIESVGKDYGLDRRNMEKLLLYCIGSDDRDVRFIQIKQLMDLIVGMQTSNRLFGEETEQIIARLYKIMRLYETDSEIAQIFKDANERIREYQNQESPNPVF